MDGTCYETSAMGYRSLQECVRDLEKTDQLVRIETEVDAHLEVGAIQRRVYRAGGPALLFTNVTDCRFPMLGNLFGTLERARYLFRDTLESVRRLIDLKLDPSELVRHPLHYATVPGTVWHLRPKKVSKGAVIQNECQLRDLPQLKSWPQDGGAFITLPQVYTEDVTRSGFARSNLGMYRIQISGGDYDPNELDIANRGTQHLFVVNPLRAAKDNKRRKKGKPVKEKAGWLDTHPPTSLRIRLLREMAHTTSFKT